MKKLDASIPKPEEINKMTLERLRGAFMYRCVELSFVIHSLEALNERPIEPTKLRELSERFCSWGLYGLAEAIQSLK